MLYILILLLALWVLAGLALYIWQEPNPKGHRGPLSRRVNRRLCVVGDHVKVTLECSARGLPPLPAQDQQLWDLALVIDRSGSMGFGEGSALNEAARAAINLIRTTPDGCRYSVVEFDHGAREICPMTDRRRGPIRAINGIGSGGGTDIAYAIEKAGRSLRRAGEDPDRQRAVILLSDGGSDRLSAIDAAKQLKDDDNELLLITIGLGAADMPLLKEIASKPDHCFQADRLNDLAALYSEIGRMISGREASDASVTESFARSDIWSLCGWGDIRPSGFDTANYQGAWFIPMLTEEKPARLTYRVEALCPGWQRIAPEKARLKFKTEDGAGHESASNSGPRILVLPRVFAWKALWLVLNPLFYIFFDQRFGHGHPPKPRTGPEQPAPRPLSDPPRLKPKPPKEPKLAVRPTLVLGLGYAGLHALVHCKRLVWERGARIEPGQVRYLALDTASPAFFRSPSSGPVGLDEQERLALDQALEPVIRDQLKEPDPNLDWIDAPRLSAGAVRPDLHRGMGHNRILGRLAMVKNRALLEARIGPLVDELIGLATDRDVDVIIAGGSGGGVASGGLLELCWLIKRLFHDRGHTNNAINLFLAAPHSRQGTETDPETRAMRQRNHRALLAELGRIACHRGEPLAPAAGETPVRQWFDRAFYVGPASAHEVWEAERVLYPKTGEAMFVWLASADAGGMRDHFMAGPRTLESCLVHRIDPVSQYLYPGALRLYLVAEGLRRNLGDRLWGLTEQGKQEFRAGAVAPERGNKLLRHWLANRPENTDFPWVFSDAFEDLAAADKLQTRLNQGAGPEISSRVSSLNRGQFFTEQRDLARAVLDTWVIDTLNHGQKEDTQDDQQGICICLPHSLGQTIQALWRLSGQLQEGRKNAAHLREESKIAVVRREAGLVMELATAASAEVDAVARRLEDWDRWLGEGGEGGGLMRLLNQTCSDLEREIERLRDKPHLEEVTRSPHLPLNFEQIEQLDAANLKDFTGKLFGQIRWTHQRADSQLHLMLGVHGAEEPWRLDAMDFEDQEAKTLLDALLKLGTDLVGELQGLTMADYPADSLPGLRVDRPRTDQLNAGARGVYLRQGEDRFQLGAHVETVELEPFDQREARVIGCEEHLSTDQLWPDPDQRGPEELPFVFPEEQNAYRGYFAWCRSESRAPEELAPSLVGLCRDPDALLGFALEGLAGNRITIQEQGQRQVFVVDSGAGQKLDLAYGDTIDLELFIRVANGWVGAGAPELRKCSFDRHISWQEVSDRVKRHRLAQAIADDDWYRHFISVIWGLLQWH